MQEGTHLQVQGPEIKSAQWTLKLYTAGPTQRALAAFANLKRICETHLAGQYEIEVIDLVANPALARQDQIFAIPTVVRRMPPPLKKVIGDLANEERVLAGLDIEPIHARPELRN